MSSTFEIDAKYMGAHDLPKDVNHALQVLASTLVIHHSACKSHSVLRASGFNEKRCIEATAIYLVSAIAQSIESNLSIRAALFDEKTFARDLHADVVSVIGESSVDADFKTMSRDPWMWEAISHMLIHLSVAVNGFHPSGKVLAKTSIKYDVNDHGLDLITIYEAGGLGISAGECKAYLSDPSRAITDAMSKLNEVESSKRDIEIRSSVNQLRSGLPARAQKLLAGSFWRNERTYIPFVCCDGKHAPDWNRNRSTLRKLNLPVTRKILIPLELPDVRGTFDEVCSYMRAYTKLKKR